MSGCFGDFVHACNWAHDLHLRVPTKESHELSVAMLQSHYKRFCSLTFFGADSPSHRNLSNILDLHSTSATTIQILLLSRDQTAPPPTLGPSPDTPARTWLVGTPWCGWPWCDGAHQGTGKWTTKQRTRFQSEGLKSSVNFSKKTNDTLIFHTQLARCRAVRKKPILWKLRQSTVTTSAWNCIIYTQKMTIFCMAGVYETQIWVLGFFTSPWSDQVWPSISWSRTFTRKHAPCSNKMIRFSTFLNDTTNHPTYFDVFSRPLGHLGQTFKTFKRPAKKLRVQVPPEKVPSSPKSPQNKHLLQRCRRTLRVKETCFSPENWTLNIIFRIGLPVQTHNTKEKSIVQNDISIPLPLFDFFSKCGGSFNIELECNWLKIQIMKTLSM